MKKERSSRMGVYLHSTHGIEYTLRHYERHIPRPNSTSSWARLCNGFLISRIGNGPVNASSFKSSPCRARLGGDADAYYQIQEQQFFDRLRAEYPEISSGCAAKITEIFMEILRIANATHLCSEESQYTHGVRFSLLHAVFVSIQPHDKYAAVAGAPERSPATRASIVELIKEAEEEEVRRSEYDSECSICMEEISPSAVTNAVVLTMPCCSHSFHGSCIVEWLDNSYSCPLCRYQMPRAKFRHLASRNWYVQSDGH